jgi:hypothetical protein
VNRLLEIGFDLAGHWVAEQDSLKFELLRYGEQKNILYAFVSDGQVKYVGKTVRKLTVRMAGYRNPGPTQSTNINNNARIRALLSGGAAVDIYALPDNGLLHYGKFHLNLAAALEDDIIRVIDPEWNGGTRESSTEQVTTELGIVAPGEQLPSLKSDIAFTFFLRPTYAKTGFFNVGVDVGKYFGADGEKIEIFCGQSDEAILGSINRRANTNDVPRIMGGAGLKLWFNQVAKIDQKIAVEVLAPNMIRLNPA